LAETMLGITEASTTRKRSGSGDLIAPFARLCAAPPAVASSRLLLARFGEEHAFELHAVGIEEIDGVVALAVVGVLRRLIDDARLYLLEERAERVDIAAARKLEGVVMKADIADAVAALAPARVRRADPEQRLAVAPPGGIGELVLELEAEKAEHRVIEALGPGEVIDPEDETDEAGGAGAGR